MNDNVGTVHALGDQRELIDAISVLRELGYQFQNEEWVSPLELVADAICRELLPGPPSPLFEGETPESKRANHEKLLANYSAARRPDPHSPRDKITTGLGRQRIEAARRVRRLGYHFDGKAWIAPAPAQPPAILAPADKMADELSVGMMASAEHLGPDHPIVLAWDSLLERYRVARYTADEIAEQDAANAGQQTYLDFLRHGLRPRA